MQRAGGPRAKNLLDQTISFTQSSHTYWQPYNPRGNLLYKMQNKVKTFSALRNFENEFVDYESYTARDQFKEIYLDLFKAFRRGDKVILNRSLSQGMYKVSSFIQYLVS